ncbi:sirohydrochlorin chelatase [Actinokineospora sp. NPDC004072]
MTLVVVAHGTRSSAGTAVAHELAEQVRGLLPAVPVRLAFADVRQPDVASVLREVRGRSVVVPLFLAAGYHVRVDVPAQVAASGAAAVITPHLGASPALVAVLHGRLLAAGWRPGMPVVLAAAESSDARAVAETRRAALLLGARTGERVRVAAVPRVAEVVGTEVVGPEVAVASWLLAPGRFHDAVAACGARVVTPPLAPHPRVAELVVRRYAAARAYAAA